MNKDWFGKPQLRARGNQAKLSQNTNIFGFICGKNGFMSQTRENRRSRGSQAAQKGKNCRRELQNKSATRQRKRRSRFQLLLGRIKCTNFIKQRFITLKKHKTLQMCWHRNATPVFVGCYTHFSEPYQM